MNRLSRGNVQSIRVRTLPAVIEMQPRTNRLARHRNNVVQMPSLTPRVETRSGVVVEMPTQASSAMMKAADPQVSSEALYCGFRIAMMALVALFGWPHPNRDNDPGPASSARPWRLERVSVVGGRRVTASVAQFPGCSAQAVAPSAQALAA